MNMIPIVIVLSCPILSIKKNISRKEDVYVRMLIRFKSMLLYVMASWCGVGTGYKRVQEVMCAEHFLFNNNDKKRRKNASNE